jgi:putative endonuclease
MDSTLAIVEVKSRTSDVFENIADTVTGKKIKLLVMATDHYITSKNIDLNIRFDIVTVLKKKNMLSIEHIEDAFYHF